MRIKLLFGESLECSKNGSFFKNFVFTILFSLVSFGMFGQVTIFSENIGVSTGTTVITSNTFENSGTLIYTGSADTRSTAISSGYIGFSGGRNVFFTASGRNFEISGINSTNFSGISLSYGLMSLTANQGLVVEVSTDGISYNILSVSPTIAASTWSLRTPTGTIPATLNLRIRFSSTSASQFRLDDVKLVGTALPVCSTPSNPLGTISNTPACGSTSLSFSDTAPAGVKYYWQTTATGTSETNQTSSAFAPTTSGTYHIRAKSDAGNCWSTGTISQAITVVAAPSISVQPTNQSITDPATANFAVAASDVASYQWQVSTDGATWNNVSSGTGGTTNSYTTPATSQGMNGYQYKVIITGNSPCTTIESTARTLTVSGVVAPVISSTLSKSSVYGATDTYIIIASNSPTSYNATGLPAGLTLSGNVISGTPSANVGSYNVSISAINSGGTDIKTLVWTITARPLTISGLSGTNRLYDGGIVASFTGSATLNNISFSDALTLSGTTTANFGDKNIGISKPIVFSGYTIAGVKSGNYTLTQPSLAATISAKPLTVTGASVQNKVYDGLTVATITGGTLAGVVAPDAITVSGNGTFADANVGTGKSVTANLFLAGTGSGNYSLTQPTGLIANITTASPVFTTSPINLNMGGIYTLPGAAISSTSSGTFSYSLSGTVATLSGLTLMGDSVGTATLTVNQMASGNYSGGSTAVVVNVSLVTYTTSDFRTTSNGMWSTQNGGTANWEKWNGSTWVASPTKPSLTSHNVFIRHTITSNGNTAIGSVVIEGVNLSDSTPGGDFSTSAASIVNTRLLVKDGGIMTINATLTNNGIFEVENNGTVNINYSSANGIAPIWNGTENFHPGSFFNIQNWNYATGSGANRLIQNPSIISPNVNGYYFGNLTILGAPSSLFCMTEGTQTINLCNNDFVVSTTAGSSSVGFTNSSSNVTIGGNVILNSGNLSCAVSTNGTPVVNILGNLLATTGTLNINQNNSTNVVCNLNLFGDLEIGANALLISDDKNSELNFSGIGDGLTSATTQTINIASTGTTENNNINFNVKSGAYVKLINRDFELGQNAKLTVENGGTLDFGFDAINIPLNVKISALETGTSFESLTGSTLKITSPLGIVSATSTTGNVQSLNRIFHPDGIYHYTGKVNQVTGSGLPTVASGKKVIIEMDTDLLTLSATTTTRFNSSGTLDIRKGTVLDNGSDFFSDGTLTGEIGNLTMSGGLYKFNDVVSTATSTTYYPRLSGVYNLTGGTVELAANTGASQYQRLRGKIYFNLKVSGISSAGGYKDMSSATTLNNSLIITENPIFDTKSHSLNGLANVIMDSGRWRNSKVSSTQPELGGTYSLTGGTMEFYGSGSANNQEFKGGITYNNIDINADTANINFSNLTEFYNVSPATSFTLNGNLNVNSPAIFLIGSSENISGPGNVNINSGSTLLYGSANGIKTTGTTTADGAIRVSGTRTFSPTASYGFTGGQATMVSGNGIPATVENLYVARTNNLLDVSLSNPSLTVKNKMYLIGGNLVTASTALQLGTDATNKGTLAHTSGFIKGTLKRWFNGNNIGDDSGLFPLGTTDNKNRFARIEFTTATSGGTLTASINPTAMGTTGISTIAAIPVAGTCPAFTVLNTDDFYWNIIPNSISGNYTATVTKESASTDPICEMTLLKRDAADWATPGTHSQPTGTPGMVTLSRTGLSGFQDFGFGNKKCNVTNIWNGTAWSGGMPTSSHKIIFAGNYNSALNGGNITACECEIQSGSVVTIASTGTTAHFLELQNGLMNNGQIVLENNNSLLQHNDSATNTGSGTFKMARKTQDVFRYDYTYWSSPVDNQDLHSLSPTTFYDKYYSWNAVANPQAWLPHNRAIPSAPMPSVVMMPGKGFVIRAPQSFNIEGPSATPGVFTAEFAGKPNNGIVNAPIIGGTDKWNLIGNPYPSAISANSFLSNDINDDIVEGTIYFWTHNTPITATPGGTTAYSYSPADYAVYNYSGSTATAPSATGGQSGNNNNIPNGFIAAGQSFFIKGMTSGDAIFNNAMRVSGNNNQFFRMSGLQNTIQTDIEKHRIWLNISNISGAFNQALVGYIENATNEYDRGYDGEILGGNNVSFYSVLSQKNLAIQGRSLPFIESDQVDLGYKAIIAGNFKISIDHFDGLFENQNIYLEDKNLNIIHDLKQSSYDFTSSIGTFNSRFILRYTNAALGIGDFETALNNVIVAVKDKTITAISAKENIESIMVFDLLGRKIYENNEVHSMNFSISEITASQQALIVKLKLENGQIVDKKIIYN